MNDPDNQTIRPSPTVIEQASSSMHSGAASPWPVFWVASIAVFLVSMDGTMLFAAFSALRAGFPQATAADLSWVLNAYTVVYAAMLIPSGGLADRHGRKKVFLVGVALFLAASVACGLAANVAWLVAARALQAMSCLVYAASALWFLLVPGTEPAYLTQWLPGALLSGMGVGMVLPSLSGAAVSHLPAAHYAVGSAINQAIRQIGSVMGVALTVLLLGGTALQRTDFNAVYLCHMSLALLTAALCLPVKTRPTAVAKKS